MAQHHSYVPGNGMPRPIQRHTAHFPDESFPSFVDRLAANHDISLGAMISHLGMVENDRYRTPVGYGIVLSETHLTRCSSVLRVEPETISRMLLKTFDGVALDLSDVNAAYPHTLRKAAQREWAYFSGSHFCPHCVKSGAWNVSWKLPWAFSCPAHEVLLKCDCPSCGLRAAGGRRDGSTEPVFHARVPRPGCCNNPLGDGRANRGKAGAPCGFNLSDADALKLKPRGPVLQAQEQVNRLLAPQSNDAADKSFRTFKELRSLVALMLYAAEVEDLGDIPLDCKKAFAAHIERRLDADADRRASPDGRNGSRPRAYIGTPKDPLMMAALVPAALRIAMIQEEDELRDALQPVVDRIRTRDSSQRNCWPIVEYFHPSERLKVAMAKSLEKRSTFDRRAGARSSDRTTEQPYNFEPCHVPQLAPEPVFDRYFARACEGTQRENARRFCSMALIKLRTGDTWIAALEALELPADFARFPNRMIVLLNKNSTYDEFSKNLALWARDVSNEVSRLNYSGRRKALMEFDDFTDEEWASICAASEIGVGKAGGRRRYSAAWLWAELTGSDWRLSPAMHRGDEKRTMVEMFWHFKKKDLAQLMPQLRRYGERMKFDGLGSTGHRNTFGECIGRRPISESLARARVEPHGNRIEICLAM